MQISSNLNTKLKHVPQDGKYALKYELLLNDITFMGCVNSPLCDFHLKRQYLRMVKMQNTYTELLFWNGFSHIEIII